MLSRDPSCVRDLLWRIRLPSAEDSRRLADRLHELGWKERSRMPQVRDLEGPEGHRLVIVPRTGRIQIRIHYLTALIDRSRAAAQVHEEMLSISSAPEEHFQRASA